MKKHSKKHNHTKAVILIMIALLGLYIISIKSGSPVRGTYGTVGTSMALDDMRNRLNQLKGQYRTATGAARASLQSRISALESEISRLQSPYAVRPQS